MTNTVTPGGGQGQGPGNVYAATAPPSPPPPPSPAPQQAATAGPPPRAGRGLRLAPFPPVPWLIRTLSRTPGQLQLLALGCVLLGLLLGAAGFSALQTRADALDQARGELDQLVTVHEAYTALAEAGSQATNLFLLGGLEDPQARQHYLDQVDRGGRALSRASSAATDLETRTELLEIHVQLARYTGLVEAARANNRQGFPIGVAYLKQSSTLLDSEILSSLGSLRVHERTAVRASLQRGGSGMFLLTGGTCLVLLGLVQLWLVRVSRRILNPPLLGATVVGVVVLVTAGTLLGSATRQADEARANGFVHVLALADARVGAFDAKSNESLALIARGNGEQYRQDLSNELGAAFRDTVHAGPRGEELFASLQNWARAHDRIQAADSAGRWEAAVDLATRRADDPRGGSNAAFEDFNQRSRSALADAGAALDLALEQPVGPLRVVAPILLVAGLLMAAAGWAGLSHRLKEFR